MHGRLTTHTADRLRQAGLEPEEVEDLAHRCLTEDLRGGQDITSHTVIAPGTRTQGAFVSRRAGTVAGLVTIEAFLEIFCTHPFTCVLHLGDGDPVLPGQELALVSGRMHDLLLAERSVLNLLSHLSGIATATRTWVDTLAGTSTAVRDTRKTTPGLRSLEKYAVRCGGGLNHRMSLSDAALLKDNHIAAAGSITQATQALRAHHPDIPMEVEVDDLAQLEDALSDGIEVIMLDNFSPDLTREAVHRTAGRARLESSGGITLAQARTYADAGVDYVAVGALTHSAPALDIGFDIPQTPTTQPQTDDDRA